MFSIPLRSHIMQRNSTFPELLKWTSPNFLRLLSVSGVIRKDPCSCEGASGGDKAESTSSSRHQIVFKPYTPPPVKPHDAKNMDLKRPMSPHLTIYAPTMPAMTSIVERITGIILVFYAVLLASGSLFLSNGVETYVSMIQSLDLSRPLIFLIKLVLGAPFAFHYFNGIRFVMWNAGRWLSMKDVYSSAKNLSFIGTAVLTVIFALFKILFLNSTQVVMEIL